MKKALVPVLRFPEFWNAGVDSDDFYSHRGVQHEPGAIT
jgi:hypothetical protein